MRPKVRVLVVAEQPNHAASVHAALSNNSDLEIVAVCSKNSGFQNAVSANEPDLVFWAMPSDPNESSGMSVSADAGFQLFALPVARCQDWHSSPFVTDGNEAEIEMEFRSMLIGRVLHQAKQFLGLDSSAHVVGEIESKAAARDRLCIKSRGRILFLSTSEIRWIEGAGNYLRIHVESESHLVRETIADFEARLDPGRFVRIHRSAIVNLDSIREMRPWPTGEYVVTLKDGKELTLSRSYRSCVARLISSDGKLGIPANSSSIRQVTGKVPRALRMYGG